MINNIDNKIIINRMHKEYWQRIWYSHKMNLMYVVMYDS